MAFDLQTNSQTKWQNSIMEAHIWVFINFKQNDWARLLLMAKFVYNNAKNASSDNMPFKLKYGYHPLMLYKKNADPCSKSKSADKLLTELKKLMIAYRKNLHHAPELQKRAYHKDVKPRSNAPDDNVWLNSKYIKTKENWKLKAKFFRSFQVLYLVKKQANKLELFRKWRIFDVFHVSLLKQDTTKKRREDKSTTKLDANDNKRGEYKIEAICDSAVYAKKSASHLPGFYHLVFWKDYPKEKNTWELYSAIQYLRKLISLFYKDHLDKQTAISKAINIAPLMARPTIKLTALKQKWG